MKVDIKHAFNTLDWYLLGAILKAFGFSNQFYSCNFVILRRLEFYYFQWLSVWLFRYSSRVRQCDPLSLILLALL